MKEQKEDRRRRHFHGNGSGHAPTLSHSSSFTSRTDSAFSMGDFHLGKGASQMTLGDIVRKGGSALDEQVDLVTMQKTLKRMSKALDLMNSQIETVLEGDDK